MYTIKKKNRIKTQLQICYASGEQALLLDVDLDTYKILPEFQKLKEKLGISLLDAQKNPGGADEEAAVGDAIIALLDLVFGEEQTAALLRFYNNNKSDALADVYVFLCEEIFPKVEKAQEQLKEEIIAFANKMKNEPV